MTKLIPIITRIIASTFAVYCVMIFPYTAEAANLNVSPATGVYTLGGTFTARVVVNTNGQPINAAEGTLTFNPRELSVVRVDRSSSVFNLWVAEPTFSNSAGTISFSGGSPTGYTGLAGTVFTVTFKSLTAGDTRLSYTSGSVLANDGRGTNVLSNMSGGTYTIEAATTQPAPEVILEYVPPANTPGAPKITSSSHPSQDSWYDLKKADLSWELPSDVAAIRTLLDKNTNSIPTKVYDSPQRSIVLDELDEGISYFHLQFKNADGWGKVAHYRIGVDTVDPIGFDAEISTTSDPANPEQVIDVSFSPDENGSPIERYLISVNGGEPQEIIDTERSGKLRLPNLSPGYHTVSVEAFDKAGNSVIDTLSFTIEAFEPPIFTDYPTELSSDVIPVLKGKTRPNAEVTIMLTSSAEATREFVVMADDSGVFTFIPEGPFTDGVYRLRAVAKDIYGAQSEPSEEIRIAVQKPGYLRVGVWLINALSVIIPLLALIVLLGISLWWLWLRARRLRGRVSIESKEVHSMLERESEALLKTLLGERQALLESKRSKKLSEQEEQLFTSLRQAVLGMQSRLIKEVRDVEQIVEKSE